MVLQKAVKTLKRFYLGILMILLITILFPMELSEVPLSSLLTVLLLLGCCVLISKVEVKCYPVLLFLGMFFVRLIAVLAVRTEPVSDFELLYTSAMELTKGNNNMLDSIYYIRWAYQAGYVWYLSVLLSIWNSLLFLKVVNCVWGAGICVLIYLITQEMAEKKSARFVSAAYGLFLFPLLFNSVLSNQIPAAVLFYVALYLMIRFYKSKKLWVYYIVPGILMAFGNVLRPEGIIMICAIIGCYILRMHKEKMKHAIFILLVLCSSYFMTFQACSLLVKYTGLNDYGLVNNEPEWKFVLGLNMETNGQYSQWDAENYLGNPDAEKEIVKKRLQQFELSNIGEFLRSKEKTILSAGDLLWSLQDWDKQSPSFLWLYYTNTLFYTIFYILLIIGVYTVFVRIETDKSLLFINILAITMLVYALIEVQARYAYIVQISVFIIAAKGYEQICHIIGKSKEKKMVINSCDGGRIDGAAN